MTIMDTIRYFRSWIRTTFWTRKCRGNCGSPEYHSHHLTRFGLWDLGRTGRKSL